MASKMLHTCLRVENLEASIAFYAEAFGFKELRRRDFPDYQFTIVYLGLEGDDYELELTYNWGTTEYEMGTAYGHIAIGVPDAYAACEKIRAAGGNVTREAGPVKGGTTVIAFVTDPDGYKVELIQRPDDHGAGTGLR